MHAAAPKKLALALWVLASAAPCFGSSSYSWFEDEEPKCSEDLRPPIVYFKTASMEYLEDPENYVGVLYGDDITAFCTAAAGDDFSLSVQQCDTSLEMNDNETYIETEVVNSVSIRWNISRPNVGRYRYRCVDTISRCQDYLYFLVVPRVTVASAGVRHVMEPDQRSVFYVPLGATYQIFCTGSESDSLKFKLNRRRNPLPTEVINETTVMYEGRADQVHTFYYKCSGEETAEFDLIVDYPPEVQEFQCTSYYNYDKLACTWRSLSIANTFNLYYQESVLDFKLLCSGTKRECKWNKRFIWDQKKFRNFDLSLRFVMQTCNKVYCNNQTFRMHQSSIMILDPISNLSVIDMNPSGTIVMWRAPDQGYTTNGLRSDKHDYKVEYRLLEKPWRRADTSSVRCDNDRCVLELNLECPEQYYELRVYVKLAAAENRLWSEPASKSFYTAPAADEAARPACRAALEEPDLVTPEAALSELHILIKHTLVRKSALRRRVRGLRPKLDVVESLTASLAESTDAGAKVPTR